MYFYKHSLLKFGICDLAFFKQQLELKNVFLLQINGVILKSIFKFRRIDDDKDIQNRRSLPVLEYQYNVILANFRLL